jgi:hypothetical protein
MSELPFDIEHAVLSTAADLFGLAMKEAANDGQWNEAVEDIIRDVLKRYPDISTAQLAFALGRALGRIEGQATKK